MPARRGGRVGGEALFAVGDQLVRSRRPALSVTNATTSSPGPACAAPITAASHTDVRTRSIMARELSVVHTSVCARCTGGRGPEITPNAPQTGHRCWYLVRGPLAGYAWQNLHYLLGLRALGYEPYFCEDNSDFGLCYDPRTGQMVPSCAYGCAFAEQVLARFGLGGRWFFRDAVTGESHGMPAEEWARVERGAVLGIDLGGVNQFSLERWTGRPTIYVDLDPGVTQLALAQGTFRQRPNLERYTVLATLGESIGTPASPLPCGAFRWRPTRPPVVVELWGEGRPEVRPPDEPTGTPAFTTIGHWNSEGRDVVVDGATYYWRKRLEFMRVLDLPRRTGQRFHLAMDVGSVAGDVAPLQAHGWTWQSPLEVSCDIERYRDFILSSLGEFSVAKDLIIRWHTGWFSDRSVCYLAAGRPVIMQETGFSRHVPTGRGLFAFKTVDEAVAAVQAIIGDYERHARAAREIASEYFDARKVLARLLAAAGVD
jgi:hypothetical protein